MIMKKLRPALGPKLYTAFHKNIPAGISGCKKKRLNNGTFFDNHYINEIKSPTEEDTIC